MEKYPVHVYRVEIDYLSKEYDNSMLSTSSPYKTLADAENEYNKACALFCVDDPKKPASVQLTRHTFADPGAYGVCEILKQNY